MKPIGELKKGLDELGIKYTTDDSDDYEIVEWQGPYNIWWQFVYDPYEEAPYGELRLLDTGGSTSLTPEHAIAVTVGTEPDEAAMLKLHDRMNVALLDYESAMGIDGGNGANAVPFVNEMHQIIEDAAKVGVGTCHYIPEEMGFAWWDENDVEHYEEDSASEDCCFASCDKCGNQMMVGDEGWFGGWDKITEWTKEDGSEHKGYVLKPRFKYCPNCGRRIEVSE